MTRSLHLKVHSGTRVGWIVEVAPGQRIVIGRDPDVGMPIADPQISGRHLEVHWDGSLASLVDLGSTNGTLLNGATARSAILQHGDEIRIGETTLAVAIRDSASLAADAPAAPPRRPESARPAAAPVPSPPSAPPREPEPEARAAGSDPEPDRSGAVPIAVFAEVEPSAEVAPPPLSSASGAVFDALVGALAQTQGTHLYVVVDAARNTGLAVLPRLSGHEVYTLFTGEMAVGTAFFGPALALVSPSSPYLSAWVESLGGNDGLLFESSDELEAVYRHLRELFIATDEAGQEYFFRYYDPRVLRSYLPTCTPDELEAFFGPIRRWIVEDERGEGYRTYALRGGEIVEGGIGAPA